MASKGTRYKEHQIIRILGAGQTAVTGRYMAKSAHSI